MMNDLIGEEPGNPKRAFASQDFKRYTEQLAPYCEKVFEQDEVLTSEDKQKIKGIRQELRTEYDSQTVVGTGLYGKISGILNFNNVISEPIRNERLKKEALNLEEELDRKRDDGTLTPEKEKRIYDLISKIHHTLDPWHHYG